MTIISPQTSYSTVSSSSADIITITPSDTITLNTSTSGSVYYTVAGGVGGLSSSTVTISNGGSSSSGFTIGGVGTGYKWSGSAEFDDCFPEWSRIEDMCEKYPGLKIAFEKFKTTYYLVKDDYDNPKD